MPALCAMEIDLLGQPIAKRVVAPKPIPSFVRREAGVVAHRPYSVTKLGKYQAMVVNDDCAEGFKPTVRAAGQSS